MKYKSKLKADSLFKGLTTLRNTYPAAAHGIVKEFAGETQRLIQSIYAPYRTGELRSTVRVEIEGKGYFPRVFVRAGGIKGNAKGRFVDYALWVNNGTSKITPRFFMEKGRDAALSNKKSLAKRSLDSWLRKINS